MTYLNEPSVARNKAYSCSAQGGNDGAVVEITASSLMNMFCGDPYVKE